VESVGILAASGLIAGEALTGLLFAWFKYKDVPECSPSAFNFRCEPQFFGEPSYLVGFCVLLALSFIMVRLPLAKAGRPEDPAPPAAMM
jgi:hypothetical protein